MAMVLMGQMGRMIPMSHENHLRQRIKSLIPLSRPERIFYSGFGSSLLSTLS